VGQSEAAETGESERLLELVSERCGEYLLCTGVFCPIDWTRLALFGTTLAVLMTGEVLVGREVGTRVLSSIGLFPCWATAVEG
jgi:hypothetical protein